MSISRNDEPQIEPIGDKQHPIERRESLPVRAGARAEDARSQVIAPVSKSSA